MNKNNNFLVINKQHIIHYYYKEPKNNLPTIIFLHGYMSDIKGKKALFLQEYCNYRNYGYLMFEYRGHGLSSGDLMDCTIDHWLNDVITTINHLAKNQQKILIGSSLGGWLAFLYTLQYPKLVNAIIGIATALDFTQDLINNQALLTKNKHNPNIFLVQNNGSTTPISKKLLTSSSKLLLLNDSVIPIEVPVRLLHGMQDQVVLYQKSLEISKKLLSNNVKTILIKNGDHSLSQPENLTLLELTIDDLLQHHKLKEEI